MTKFGACVALFVVIGLALAGVANAAPPCGSKDVLIVYSDIGPPNQLVTNLLAEQGVTSVDLFDAQFENPTLDDLMPYNLVVTWSNYPYSDADGIGDVFADYQDSGEGLVMPMAFSFFAPDYSINGRWLAENYSPFTYSQGLWFESRTLGTHDASHPLMQGVTALATNFGVDVGVAGGATQVAAWNTGAPLVAFKGDVVAINAYIGPDATWSGQFSRVLVNGFNWLCGGPPPPPPPPPPTCPVGSTEVTVGDNFFNPATVNVPVGGTVCWRNMGQVAHTATSDTGVFNSGTLNPGQVYSFTFNS
ncbi:MAG TPA: hypothetical protein VFT86_11555, partial [Gaiellaceae bacterium]|nr:hypothetical protein [Gaiellaceae bacterium]